MRSSRIALAICAGVSTLGAQAIAQTTSTAPEQELTEIVVTGSRIVRNGNNAPTPVTVANVEQLAVATPTNIPDALNKLPAFNSSRSAATLGNGANPNQGNYLNLRAFGFNRVLILMDGRRVPGTTFTGDINTDTLPQMLVQRVDVVTGGASAVYGSDAVTGVVNYILDKQFVGLKGVAQYGISDYGDDNSWRIGVAGGTEVGERGHFIFSAEHFDREGIESKYDRPLGRAIWQETGSGTVANPFRRTENGRLNTTSFGGRIIQTGTAAGQLLPASLLNTQFLPGSVLGSYNIGDTATGTNGISSGGDGGYVNGNAATAPLVSTQAFARYQFDMTDNVTAFVQGNWSQSENSYHGQNEFRPYTSPNAINIYTGNAYLPANVQSIMNSPGGGLAPVTQFGLGRYNDDFGNLILMDAVNKAIMLTAGVEGKFGDSWNWDAFYTRGEGSVRLDSFDNVNNGRFYAAIDAVRDSNNNIVCRVTITNPGLYPGCVPMNILGDKSPSQASIDYITGDTWWDAKNTLDDFGVNLTGQLGRTWAGPISVATGAEYRKNVLRMHTSDDPRTPFNATGLRVPAINGTGTQNWTRNVVAPTNGDSNVWEANVEAVFPLLADKAFAKVLELNGAARYTDYSTTGEDTTWKVGVNWQPFDDLRVRGTRSKDIRAPSLFELYQAESLSITGFTDLHTSFGGSTNTSTRGNPDLVPEVANTLTVGLVYSPSQVPGLSFSIDYYDISIDNAIASVGGNSPSAQQLCEASGGTSPICSLYIRPLPFSDRTTANYPTLIKSQNLNIAETSTHGVDVEINYATNLGPGYLDLRLLAAFQPVLYQRTLPGTTLLDFAGAASVGPGSPAVQEQRYTLNATYKLDKLAMNAQIRYLDGLAPSADPTLVYAPGQDIPAFTYVDLAATYDIESGGMTFTPFLSINNAFNKEPPLHASTAFTGNPGFYYPVPTGYDIVGRYYTAGVRFKF